MEDESCRESDDFLIATAVSGFFQELKSEGVTLWDLRDDRRWGNSETRRQWDMGFFSVGDPGADQPDYPGLEGVFVLFSEDEALGG